MSRESLSLRLSIRVSERVALPQLFVLSCLLLASAARAEEPRETPDASRRSTAVRSVVTRDEIERRQWRTLVELLQGQPGLHVSQLGGLGQPSQLFLRGERRGRVLVRLDGIEISDPASKDPGTVLPDLLTVDIEQVEIQRGAQGVTAGNDALGGVIDIVTRRGSGSIAPWARVEAGGFGTYQSSGGIRGGTESVDYALSYTHLHSRGINVVFRKGERDGYENDSVGGRLGLRPIDGLRLGVTGRFLDVERGADTGDVQLDDPTDPSPATLNLFDLDGSRRDARRLFLRGEAELSLFDDRWIQLWSVGYTDHANAIRLRSPTLSFVFPSGDRGGFLPNFPGELVRLPDPRPQRRKTDADSSRLEVAWTHELRIDSHHDVRLGAQVDNETFRTRDLDQDAFSNLLFSPLIGGTGSRFLEVQTDVTTTSHERARNLSAFVEDRFSFDDFFGEIGARVQDHDEFGSQLSYRVGLGYIEPRTQLKLFASFGTAFRDPDLAIAAATRLSFQSQQLLQPPGSVLRTDSFQGSRTVLRVRGSGSDFELTDPDLEAEQVRAAEVGVEAPFLGGRGDAGIVLFSTRSRHVASRTAASDGFDRVIFDLAEDSLEARARGVETWLRLDVAESLGLELDYTYTRSRLGHDPGLLASIDAEGGDAQLGVPRHRADASIRYAPFDGFEGWFALRYVGRSRDEVIRSFLVRSDPILTRQSAFREQVTRGAYTTFDVGIRWKLRSDVTLFARVENLFDREYSDPVSTASPGRAGYVGLELELGR
jgi:vitamin B12 transporter